MIKETMKHEMEESCDGESTGMNVGPWIESFGDSDFINSPWSK